MSSTTLLIGCLSNCSSTLSSASGSGDRSSTLVSSNPQRLIQWKTKKRSIHLRKPYRYRNSVVSIIADPTISPSGGDAVGRREVLFSSIGFVAGVLLHDQGDQVAVASEFADMPALRGKDYGKSKMRYPDYTETESGLQYKDLRVGDGPNPKMGETVVVDWDGYTIGYYGRIFEARNKTKGGSFEGEEKEFFKFKLGSQQVIPAFEEAIVGMQPGGVRR